MGVHRYLWVYTPPNYDTSSDRYPVFYLLHGNGETQSGWVANGRANIILDNLIADGRAEPMIVVMPHGHPIQSASVGPFALVPPDGRARDAELPAVHPGPAAIRSFRSSSAATASTPTRTHRAIGGLSMGGFQSIEIGLAHPELFGYVLAYSGGFGSLGPQPPAASHRDAVAVEGAAGEPAGHDEEPAVAVSRQRPAGDRHARARDSGSCGCLQAQGINARWSDYSGRPRVQRVAESAARIGADAVQAAAGPRGVATIEATCGAGCWSSRCCMRRRCAGADRIVAAANEHWVTTWATAQQLAPTRLPFGGRDEPPPPPPAARVPATLKDQTVRMIARASIGGRRVRVRLANALEKPTLRVGAAHIALRSAGAAIVPASDRALTFGGRPSTVVPPGTMVLSDPVDLVVPRAGGPGGVAVSAGGDRAADDPSRRHAHGVHRGGNATGSATLDAGGDDDRVSLAVGRRRAGAGGRRRHRRVRGLDHRRRGGDARHRSRLAVAARGEALVRRRSRRPLARRQPRAVGKSPAAARLRRERAGALRSRRAGPGRRAMDDRDARASTTSPFPPCPGCRRPKR